MNKENYESLLRTTKIFQSAVKKAQKRHKEMEIPNVYSKTRKFYGKYQMEHIRKLDPKSFYRI